jgi:hypothetical protein
MKNSLCEYRRADKKMHAAIILRGNARSLQAREIVQPEVIFRSSESLSMSSGDSPHLMKLIPLSSNCPAGRRQTLVILPQLVFIATSGAGIYNKSRQFIWMRVHVMANIRSLITRSAAASAIVLTTSFLAACNNSSETAPAKTEASKTEKTPDAGADASGTKTMKAEDKSKSADAKAMTAEDPSKALDALKKSLAGGSSADMQKKSEDLWTAKEYASAVAISEMAYKADGNKNAAYRLGTAYYGGTGVDKNLVKAAEYLNIPALDDVSYAVYYRGLILADKSYSGFDIKKAKMSLEKAKQMGVAEAEDALKALPAN